MLIYSVKNYKNLRARKPKTTFDVWQIGRTNCDKKCSHDALLLVFEDLKRCLDESDFDVRKKEMKRCSDESNFDV